MGLGFGFTAVLVKVGVVAVVLATEEGVINIEVGVGVGVAKVGDSVRCKLELEGCVCVCANNHNRHAMITTNNEWMDNLRKVYPETLILTNSDPNSKESKVFQPKGSQIDTEASLKRKGSNFN